MLLNRKRPSENHRPVRVVVVVVAMAGHYENTGKCLASIGFLCSVAAQPVLMAKYSSLLYCLLVVLMIYFLARRVLLPVLLPGGVACYYQGGRNRSWICSSVFTIRLSPFKIVSKL